MDDVGCDAQPSRRNKVNISQLKIFINFFLFLLMVNLVREKVRDKTREQFMFFVSLCCAVNSVDRNVLL